MHLATRIDGPVAVIGDLHGQMDLLSKLLDHLEAYPGFNARWLVFLGDLVDRGPNPAGALAQMVELLDYYKKVTCVAGNHDFAMGCALGIIPSPSFTNWNQRWVDHYDSETTFASYGVHPGDIPTLAHVLPPLHAELLASLPWCVEHPDYLFVHAGLDPLNTYATQVAILKKKDPTIARPIWLCSQEVCEQSVPSDCTKTIVSGHVRYPEVQFRDRKILCDTTGGREGELSCVLLPENLVITSGSPIPKKLTSSKTSSSKRSWMNKIFS